jgi:hypothetical protein
MYIYVIWTLFTYFYINVSNIYVTYIYVTYLKDDDDHHLSFLNS